METLIKNVPHAQPFALKGQVEYEGGKVVSLTLAQQPGAGITLFAFDAGEAIRKGILKLRLFSVPSKAKR